MTLEVCNCDYCVEAREQRYAFGCVEAEPETVASHEEAGDWPGWTLGDEIALGEACMADQPDMVDHPPHYTAGGIECIDAIRAALTPEEFRGFCKGNALKYVWREHHKGGAESLAKAGWYLDKLKD